MTRERTHRRDRRGRREEGKRIQGTRFLQKAGSPDPSGKNSYMASGNTNASEGPGNVIGATGGRPLPSPFSKGGHRGIRSASSGKNY